MRTLRSTAILFVPFSLIIPTTTPSTESASLLDLGFSAVDIVVSASDPTTFHVALDLARPSPSQTTPASEALSVRTVKLSAAGALEVVAASDLEALVQKSAVEGASLLRQGSQCFLKLTTSSHSHKKRSAPRHRLALPSPVVPRRRERGRRPRRRRRRRRRGRGQEEGQEATAPAQ